ncbi:hypothetical protein D3C85_1036010 [compost metagenome]
MFVIFVMQCEKNRKAAHYIGVFRIYCKSLIKHGFGFFMLIKLLCEKGRIAAHKWRTVWKLFQPLAIDRVSYFDVGFVAGLELPCPPRLSRLSGSN